MKQNTFKDGKEPQKEKPEVYISPKDMAIYRLVSLKLEYQKNEVQSVIDNIRYQQERRLIRLNNIVTRSFAAAVIIAVISMVIKISFR